LYIVGNIIRSSTGSLHFTKSPGKAFIVSGYSESYVFEKMRKAGYKFLVVGSILIMTSAYYGIIIFAKSLKDVVLAPV